MKPTYYVYILSGANNFLYIGVTNELARRLQQHRQKSGSRYTAKYDVTRLVFYEEFQYVNDAIAREKQLKSWRRSKKVELVEMVNPKWQDLSEGWFKE